MRFNRLDRFAPVAVAVVIFLILGGLPLSTAEAAQHVPNSASRRDQSSVKITPLHVSKAVQSVSDQVNPLAYYSAEPAPMGIADFGVGSSGAYQYSTNSSLGILSIGSLSVRNSTGNEALSIQLNVNLEFTSANQAFVYWIQDVAQLDSNNNTIFFFNNIWNFSAPNSEIRSGLSGSGQIYVPPGYYFDEAPLSAPGNMVTLSYPRVVELEVNSSVNALQQPQLRFAYNDGYGWEVYDEVTFTAARHLTSLPGFVVDGTSYNPLHLFYDAELILGGQENGWSTNDVSSDVKMQLEYWNGNNYQQVFNAYNFGSDTGETIGNAISQFGSYTANGQPLAELLAGPGALGVLYDHSVTGTLSISSTLKSGDLDLRNLADSGASPSETGFVGGNVTVVLVPGEYAFQVFSGGALYASGNATVTAGVSTHLTLQPQGTVAVAFDYSVVGGSAGSSAPILRYTSGGTAMTAVLTATSTVFYMDPGTSWSVPVLLPGSSSSERWSTAMPTSGTATSAQNITEVYYHQYQLSVEFTAQGGSPQTLPALSYVSLGIQSSVTLSTASQSLWADSGSQYSVPTQFGPSPSERWSTTNSSGTVGGPAAITFTYEHQFLLTVVGGNLGSAWYDSGAVAQIEIPGVFMRSAGTGQRVASYSIDNGTAIAVQPTTGDVSVSVTMSAPHLLTVDSLTQFQVVLSASAGAALSSITPPTIPGDDYWYDAGTQVTLVLSGVWGRSGGAGNRLTSVTINGKTTGVATAGQVSAFSVPSLQSPEIVSATSTVQDRLTLVGESPASITQPPIPGDNYWYDNGTTVNAAFDYSWNSTSTSRTDAVSYSVSAPAASVSLRRSSTGTFTVAVPMAGPETVEIKSVVQFSIGVSGGSGITYAPPSPTNDSFYDSGTDLTVTTGNVWGIVDANSRQNLVSYLLDGKTENVTRSGSGTFTTPAISMISPHQLSFMSETQYLIGFQFEDAAGSATIHPTSLEIEVTGPATVAVPGFEIWLDSGTAFRIWSLTWEGANVTPQNSTSYRAGGPANETVRAEVFEAKLAVTDELGIPVSGATVSATLQNGTTVQRTTPANGTVDLGLVPIGTFSGSVSYLGLSTGFAGDASQRITSSVKVDLSYPTLALTVAVLAVAGLAVVIASRRRTSASRVQAPAGPAASADVPRAGQNPGNRA